MLGVGETPGAGVSLLAAEQALTSTLSSMKTNMIPLLCIRDTSTPFITVPAAPSYERFANLGSVPASAARSPDIIRGPWG